jgi:hypothetical protein
MSSAFAFQNPAQRLEPLEHSIHSDIATTEIVTTREQRRARPRVFYALFTVTGLFGLFLLQLLLSIAIAGGAYHISDLQVQQRSLIREQEALVETLNVLASPQNIATKAESLGMMLGSSPPAFLQLADGSVVGPERRTVAGAKIVGSKGNLVPNILLSKLAVEQDQPALVIAKAGAPSPASPAKPVASVVEQLPSPVTR